MSLAQHLPALQVVVPLLAAPLTVLLRRGSLAFGVALAASWFALAAAIALWLQVGEGGTISYAIGSWPPPWGIEYRVDSLSAFVLVLVAGIAAVVLPYSRASIEDEVPPQQHYLYYTMFLLCLVFSASLMPVEKLPAASWPTTLGLGFISAVFDNIPLTKLALEQRGYDWGMLAYAVGFGGSMVWFGSSAGVAVAGLMPEAKSAARWLREGWPVVLAYIAGFCLMLVLLGWNPKILS